MIFYLFMQKNQIIEPALRVGCLRVASPRRRTPHSHHTFFAAGWVDYPAIFVEAGLEIPYSIEVFDQAMQKDFQDSVAVALDVRPYRVKIDNINVSAPHARRRACSPTAARCSFP